MKRKLVKQGAATMMISLPSKWIKENKLDKGDEVDLIEKNNTIIIGSSEIKKESAKIKITPENNKYIGNLLTQAYRKGFDKIILIGDHKNISKEIRDTVTFSMLGFEITSSKEGELAIENISEPTEQRYEIIIKKVFTIIKETIEIISEDVKKGVFNNITDISDLRKQHDRFTLFCRRLISKGKSDRNSVSEWEILTFLMHIEHKYYYLYQYLQSNKIKTTKEMTELLSVQTEGLDLLQIAYFDHKLEAISKLYDLRDKYYFGKCIQFLEKSSAKNSIVISELREIIRLIQIGASPIASEIIENC